MTRRGIRTIIKKKCPIIFVNEWTIIFYVFFCLNFTNNKCLWDVLTKKWKKILLLAWPCQSQILKTLYTWCHNLCNVLTDIQFFLQFIEFKVRLLWMKDLHVCTKYFINVIVWSVGKAENWLRLPSQKVIRVRYKHVSLSATG